MVTMLVSFHFYLVVIAFTIAERLYELRVANRNYAESMAKGGVEFGSGHYPYMVLMHTLFFVSCLIEPNLNSHLVSHPSISLVCASLILGCQGMRWWIIYTLSSQWNTRVVVVPGASRVRSGPFRYFTHPNYAVVAVELISLPMLHGAWVTAVLFTIANIFLMRTRIAIENEALRLLANEQ
jgi:methyltransferase